MEDKPKKLYRSRQERIIAGVCGGLGQYFNIDPIFVRIVFILLTLANGAGIIIYLILLLVIPEEPGEHIEIDRGEKIKEFAESVRREAKSLAEGVKNNKSWFDNKRNIFGLIVIFIGFIILINQFFNWHWFQWHLFWPILIIIIGLYFIFKNKGK